MMEHEGYKRVIMKDVSRFYVVDTEEKSIRKLVEAMGVEDEFFVGFYEFKEGYEWDQMIIKNEITKNEITKDEITKDEITKDRGFDWKVSDWRNETLFIRF